MNQRDFHRRPMGQIVEEGRHSRMRRAYSGLGKCPECHAFPGAPCRDRGWGGGMRDNPHASRSPAEDGAA